MADGGGLIPALGVSLTDESASLPSTKTRTGGKGAGDCWSCCNKHPLTEQEVPFTTWLTSATLVRIVHCAEINHCTSEYSHNVGSRRGQQKRHLTDHDAYHGSAAALADRC